MKILGLNSNEKIRSLARSFKFAGKGIIYCVRNERNFRIHLTAAVYVLVFSLFYNFSRTEMLIIFITIAMVLFAEAVNTAVEAMVNLETQSYDSLARIAKDVAAGAVLICAVFALVIGIYLFIRPLILAYIFNFLIENYVYGILFLVSIPLAVIFISGCPWLSPRFPLKKLKK